MARLAATLLIPIGKILGQIDLATVGLEMKSLSVQQLIDQLKQVADKTLPVEIWADGGRSPLVAVKEGGSFRQELGSKVKVLALLDK